MPQGSKLGPLLYVIYAGDLRRVVDHDVDVVLCADNTRIIVSTTGRRVTS